MAHGSVQHAGEGVAEWISSHPMTGSGGKACQGSVVLSSPLPIPSAPPPTVSSCHILLFGSSTLSEPTLEMAPKM